MKPIKFVKNKSSKTIEEIEEMFYQERRNGLECSIHLKPSKDFDGGETLMLEVNAGDHSITFRADGEDTFRIGYIDPGDNFEAFSKLSEGGVKAKAVELITMIK